MARSRRCLYVFSLDIYFYIKIFAHLHFFLKFMNGHSNVSRQLAPGPRRSEACPVSSLMGYI